MRKDVDAKVAVNEKAKARIAITKAEIGEAKQLVQQEELLQQDAFVMQS